MNFIESRIFSFPPMSFSDFCLLFLLLVLRKGFVAEIFAVHSGTLLFLAVCSVPPRVLPVHVDHMTFQPTCSCIIPGEMCVRGYSLSHSCYYGQGPHIWGIAYSPRKQDKIQTPEKSWAGGLDAEGGGGGFRKGTYMMVHFWLHCMWITAVLETKILKVSHLHQAPGDVEMLCWAGWKERHGAGARSSMVYLNLFMDAWMYDSHPSTS